MSESYPAIYRGSVYDIEDPEGRGRLRLLVPQVLGDSPSAWAEPTLPTAQTAKPDVGDRVWVLFEGGDINLPTYISRFEVQTADISPGAITADILDPNAIPTDEDGEAPAVSPTPIVVGGLRSLFVSYKPVLNSSIVTYQVHVDTDPNTIPVWDGPTLVAETKGSNATVSSLGDGSALSYDIPYYAWIIAADADGVAPPSPVSTPTYPLQVNSPDVAVDAVWAGKAYINQLIGGSLRADMLLAAYIKSLPGNAGVDIGPDGITIWDPNTGTPAIRLPSDLSLEPAEFNGEAYLDFLRSRASEFLGEATFKPGSSIRLEDKVHNPTSQPTVTSGWPVSVTIVPPDGRLSTEVKNAWWDHVHSKWLVTYVYSTGYALHYHNADGSWSSLLRTWTGWNNGITASAVRSGNNVWSVWSDGVSTYLHVYDIVGLATVASRRFPNAGGIAAANYVIGWDYVNSAPMLAVWDSDIDKYRYQRFVTGDGLPLLHPTTNTLTDWSAVGGTISLEGTAPPTTIKATSDSAQNTGMKTSGTGTGGFAVRGGAQHRFYAEVWASHARPLDVVVRWYDVNGALIYTSTYARTAPLANNTPVTWTDVAPIQARYAQIEYRIAASAASQWLRVAYLGITIDAGVYPDSVFISTGSPGTLNLQPAAVMRGAFDFGSTQVVLSSRYSTVTDHWVFADADGGALDTTRMFNNTDYSVVGLAWDGTYFWTLSNDGVLYRHSAMAAPPGGFHWVAYLFEDRNPAGTITAPRTDGQHSTMLGPKAKIATRSRSYLSISVDPPDTPATVDDPDSVGIYVGGGSVEPAVMYRQPVQPAVGMGAVTYADVVLSGDTAPTVNDFPAQVGATIRDEEGHGMVYATGNGEFHGLWVDSRIYAGNAIAEFEEVIAPTGSFGSVREVKSGTITAATTANTWVAFDITFATPFAAGVIPAVSAQWYPTGAPGSTAEVRVAISDGDRTNTGFRAYVYRNTSSTTKIGWIATTL